MYNRSPVRLVIDTDNISNLIDEAGELDISPTELLNRKLRDDYDGSTSVLYGSESDDDFDDSEDQYGEED